MKPTTKAKQRGLVEEIIQTQEIMLEQLKELLAQLHNRKAPRGRTVSDPITPAKIAEIRRLKAEHPRFAHQEIAHLTNVNIGRVSEILRGKRV